MSWQDDVNRKLEEKRKAAAALESQQKKAKAEATHAEKLRKMAEVEQQEQEKLSQHKASFKCAIVSCNVRSTGPRRGYTRTTSQYGNANFNSPTVSSEPYVNWDAPENLYRCYDCKRWFCAGHFYRDGGVISHRGEGRCQACMNAAIENGIVR